MFILFILPRMLTEDGILDVLTISLASKKRLFLIIPFLLMVFSVPVLATTGQIVHQRTDSLDSRLYDYAKNAPDAISKNVDNLTAYLLKVAHTDKEKVKVLSYWIIEHIRYDMEGYLSGNIAVSNANATLAAKKGVCQNYADLFKSMCDRANIPCLVITGYAKGLGYDGKIMNQTNHAWNMVKLDQRYFLFDLTWASGYAGYQNGSWVFVKRVDLEECFGVPQTFIEKHMPANPRFQMLPNPVKMKNFIRYESYSDMRKDSVAGFNYRDSIAQYEKLSKLDYELLSAEDAYRFHPSLPGLISSYALATYDCIASKTYDERNLKRCAAVLQKGLLLMKEKTTAELVPYQSIFVTNLEYINYRLNKKS